VLLLLADGTQGPVTELPGQGPWTFLVLRPEESGPPSAEVAADPGAADSEPGGAARGLTRFGRAVVLVGLGELAPVALRGAADQPWAWRALERLLDRLGGGPGWAGIAPDAPPR
jgi:hypothetical protein